MISNTPSSRLVKHIIRSYARLAENNRVRSILRDNIPNILKDKNFYATLDESSKRWLQNLMKLLANANVGVANVNINMNVTGNNNSFMINNMNMQPIPNEIINGYAINNFNDGFMDSKNSFNYGNNINGASNINNMSAINMNMNSINNLSNLNNLNKNFNHLPNNFNFKTGK